MLNSPLKEPRVEELLNCRVDVKTHDNSTTRQSLNSTTHQLHNTLKYDKNTLGR